MSLRTLIPCVISRGKRKSQYVPEESNPILAFEGLVSVGC